MAESSTKKRLALLELPEIITGFLMALVVFWEIGWHRVESASEQLLFLDSYREILFGLSVAYFVLVISQGVLLKFLHKAVGRDFWVKAGLSLATLFFSANMYMPFVDVPYAAQRGVSNTLYFCAGWFSYLLARRYYLDRAAGKFGKGRSAWPPALLFLVSIIALALVGALFLLTPGASHVPLSLVDSIFVSTSAMSGTGLLPGSVMSNLTPMGKMVVLVLIQVGAFGVMTFTYFLSLIVGQGMSVRDRVTFSNILDQQGVAKAATLIKGMVILTFVMEALGAVGLWYAWRGLEGVPQDHLWWYAIFHSLSGFCNAGISLFPDNMAQGCVAYDRFGQGIMILIMFAGCFGFAVYIEFIKRMRIRLGLLKDQFLPPHWSTHTWLAVRMTLIVALGGGLILGLLGYFEPSQHAAQSLGSSIWEGVYNSVGRTAGFNISNIGTYGVVYALFLAFLVFIGGNPGSTAGGLFTTVFATVCMEVKRVVCGQQDVEFHRRRIARKTVERAVATMILLIFWLCLMTMILLLVEPKIAASDQGVLKVFFEVVSAYVMSGFSLGITADLSTAGKYLIILNMIVGRVGIFSFLLAFIGTPETKLIRYPETRLPLS